MKTDKWRPICRPPQPPSKLPSSTETVHLINGCDEWLTMLNYHKSDGVYALGCQKQTPFRLKRTLYLYSHDLKMVPSKLPNSFYNCLDPKMGLSLWMQRKRMVGFWMNLAMIVSKTIIVALETFWIWELIKAPENLIALDWGAKCSMSSCLHFTLPHQPLSQEAALGAAESQANLGRSEGKQDVGRQIKMGAR